MKAESSAPSSFHLPSPSFLDALSGRRLLLFGGKGGVGKTTLATAAALSLAATQQVVLFSSDPASNLSDLFPDGPPAGIRIEQLHADELYQRFLAQNLESFLEIGDRGTYLDREELRRFFELSLPGADELMAWMRIGELAEEEPEAAVVVDTAPTGHALRMLGAAEHFRQLAAALDAMQEKHRGMVRQFTRREVRDAIDAFIAGFEAQARRRREMLRDPARTAFLPVLLSEPWVVEQTLRLVAQVRAEGIDVPFAILNRAVGQPDCGLCLERKAADATVHERLAPLKVVEYERWCGPISALAQQRYSPRRSDGDSAGIGEDTVSLPSAAKLLFLAGKGGVGKTTSAASIALQLARAEPHARFTIISVDPAHALRDVFATEAPPQNLTVEAIDTQAKWRRFRDTLGAEIEKAIGALAPRGMRVAYDTEALQKLIEVAPPGADELFAVNRLADLAADETQELVIVDTAPTGHFLRLMDLPATAGAWVREFMRILLRYRELIPAGSLGAELVKASRSLSALDETLHSPRAAVLVVTRPEPVVLAETKRLLADLERRQIATAGIIANYVTPETECPCDRSARAAERGVLEALGHDLVLVPRRERPVTRLDELARLFTVASDSTE